MRNIEIKARVRSLAEAERTASRLAGPEPHAVLVQNDTYFNVSSGRLKLREQSDETTGESIAQLVYYNRPDETGPRGCDYEIARVSEPEKMAHLLGSALGVEVVVAKRRTLYLYENVRIHLDRVDNLGEFIEFEAVMPEGEPDGSGESVVRRLIDEFSLKTEDLVEVSYCDLLREARR